VFEAVPGPGADVVFRALSVVRHHVKAPRVSFRDELDESGEHRRSPGADGVGADLAHIGKELAAEGEMGQGVMRSEFELELKEGRSLRTDAG